MTDPTAGRSADELLDIEDQAILDRLDRIGTQLDPPPPGLDDLVGFAMSLEHVDLEVARLADDALVGAAYRGDEDGVHTLTFEADSRAVMVTVVEHADGTVRLDGWVAPAATLRVELRWPGRADQPEPEASSQTRCDPAGGFVFDNVPHGLAQLVVFPPQPGERIVVTPAFAL